MKSSNSLIVAAILASGATMLHAKAPEALKPGEAKLRPTHQALMKRKAEAAEKANAARGKRGLKPVEPGSIKYKPKKDLGTLIDRSTILCSGRNWTLVPKEAVLHVPPALQSRVDGKRTGKLVPWPQFFAKNRGWIHTHSVAMDQARGKAPISEEQVDAYKRLSRVVVAVCHNGPISVKPLKIDEKVAAAPAAK